jgi:aromatic ring hydroxylase
MSGRWLPRVQMLDTKRSIAEPNYTIKRASDSHAGAMKIYCPSRKVTSSGLEVAAGT